MMRATKKNAALSGTMRAMLLSLVVAGGISSEAALARTIYVEIAPPPARVEVIPVQRHGYVWAPGYWGWQHDKHVWVNGRSMRVRNGYQWAPDHWQEVNGRHQYYPGRWTRDSDHHGQ